MTHRHHGSLLVAVFGPQGGNTSAAAMPTPWCFATSRFACEVWMT